MRSIGKSKDLRRFVIYSIYAWGIPLLFTLMLYLIEFHSDFPDEWKPQFGKRKSWFDGKLIVDWLSVCIQISTGIFLMKSFFFPADNSRSAYLTFFVLPIGCHIASNAVLFILTAIYCSKVKGNINKMEREADKDKIQKRFSKEKTK